MPGEYCFDELNSARTIKIALESGQIDAGLRDLRALEESIYTTIPAEKRISRGVTWVMQRCAGLLIAVCESDADKKQVAMTLDSHLKQADALVGVPIFMMGQYGQRQPGEVLAFFERMADAEDWVVREFAAAGFRLVIAAQKEFVHPWLVDCALSDRPRMRRLASESLRPVTVNRWLNREPEYSLSVLRRMYQEAHPYLRTSVGNNLSDLSRQQPELIFQEVGALMNNVDQNSRWIAYRACRNLVKKYPHRVMGILGVDEYHYKDRNFFRRSTHAGSEDE
jgi:3-methyladenine DNA glycosylase AlkC